MKRIDLIACLLLVALPAAGGVVYEIEVTNHEQSPPQSESIEAAVEGRHLKMGIAASDWNSGSGNGRGEMIFRGDRREAVVVDHEESSYFVLDEETMRALAAQVNQATSMMDEALKNVPKDQRAMIEQMMKEKMPQTKPIERPQTELKKTIERATHSGYPCVKYEVLQDGRKVRELWITDWANIEGGTEVVGVFEDMSEFFKEMLDSIPQFAGDGADQPFFEHLQELGGFPVVTRDFGDGGDLESESTLRSATRRTLDPDEFEPPAGYKRREMFQGR